MDKNSMCLVWKLEDSSEILSPQVFHSETHAREDIRLKIGEKVNKNILLLLESL